VSSTQQIQYSVTTDDTANIGGKVASQSASEKISGSTVMLVVGLIADISAAALFLVSSDTRTWLRDHYMAITVASLLIVAVALTLLNTLLSHKGQISELQEQLSELRSQLKEPTEHDIEMLKAINNRVSPQSSILLWLREGFLVTRAPTEQVNELERVVQFFEREPRGFDDHDVEEDYRRFIDAGRGLVNKISEHMWYDGQNGTWLAIPREWDREQPERRDQAMEEISEARHSFIEAYDGFFLCVQRKRMRSAIAEQGA
jgi:hypothetical protein